MSRQQLSLLHRMTRSVRTDAMQLPDLELVRRFAQGRDPDAFELLLWRHGAMVWGVCRRLLINTHDAEDAFQATFLTLARSAGTIGERGAVVAWLYRVALHTSLAARKARQRRAVREWLTPEPPEQASGEDPAHAASARDLRRLIDEEVNGLPEKLRLPFLLCEIEGRCRVSAAAELGCPVGTIESRLSRARQRLRTRLLRRGLALPATLAVTVPGSLRAAALRLAAETPAVSRPVRALAEQAARTALPGRPLVGALATCLLAACAGFAVLAGPTREPTPQQQTKETPVASAKSEPAVAPAEAGAALPAGVLTRIGSPRLRHTGSVASVAFSADGRWIASTDDNGTACVWDSATGKLRHRFPGGKTPWHPTAFSPDSKTLLTLRTTKGPGDTTWLHAFDLATGKELPVRGNDAGAQGTVRHGYSLSADGRYFGFGDGQKFFLHDTESGKLIQSFDQSRWGMAPPAFASEGKLLALTSGNDALRVVAVETTREMFTVTENQGLIRATAFTPDSTILATLSVDTPTRKDSLALWEVKTGKLIRRITDLEVTAYCLAFSPDGKRLAVGNLQRLAVQLFDTATGKELRRFRSWPSVRQVVFSPDGKSLAAGRTTGTVSVWDVETGKPRPASADPAAGPCSLAFTEKGLLIDGGDGPAVHDWRTGKVIRRYADPRTKSFEGFALSADGRLMALSEFDGSIRLMDAATGKTIRILRGHTTLASPVLFSPDGRRLFSRGYDQTLRIWDVEKGKEQRSLKSASNTSGERLAVSPDGKMLATATWEGSGHLVRIWDADRGQELHRCDQGAKIVFRLTFSPDGTLLAAAGSDGWSPVGDTPGTVTLWDTATGQRRRTLAAHQGGAIEAVFSPDGRMLATGGYDKVIRFWEIATGKERHELHGHEGAVYALAFSKGGRHLASSSQEAPVFVWNVYGSLSNERAAGLPRWEDLADADAAQVFEAIGRLAAVPAKAIALCRANLKPASDAGQRRIRQLIADLDSPRFAVRQKATTELEKKVEDVEPLLRKALQEAAVLEVKKRLEGILAHLGNPGPDRLRQARAVEVLEIVATPEAIQLLDELAGGAASARLTRDAAAARDRLRKR
jgi:RNA polymerase sigma factor (sigma-70 family)